MSGNDGVLREWLTLHADSHGVGMKDLTVLAVGNDPYRIDTPAGHRDGAWLADNVEALGLADRPIHLRGLHYALVTSQPRKPNGQPYRNTTEDWSWLQDKAADAARWLGYVDFERIIDHRNDPPLVRERKAARPQAWISVGVEIDIPSVEDLQPRPVLEGFRGRQPYHLVMFGEKRSLEPVLAPLAETYDADLYLMTGEISDTLLHRMAGNGATDGRPMIVLCFSDCDPSGWQMPISIARKLQAFQTLEFDGLEFQVHRVALTPAQAREYGLPSTPLKATEQRAGKWLAATGAEQTEIDALASLQPDLLEQMASHTLRAFHDSTLERRVRAARREWLDRAEQALTGSLDADRLAQIRVDAAERLSRMEAEIEALNDALLIEVGEGDLPEIPPIPNADAPGETVLDHDPLIDSEWDFVTQCQRLIGQKSYATFE